MIFLGILLGCHYLAFRHPRRSRAGKALQRSGKVKMLGVCVVAPLSLFLSLGNSFPLLQVVLNQLILFWIVTTTLDTLYLLHKISKALRRVAVLTVVAGLLSLAGWNEPTYRDTFTAVLITLLFGASLLALRTQLLSGTEKLPAIWQPLKHRLVGLSNLLVVVTCLYFLLRAFTVVPITSGQLEGVEGCFQLCLALMGVEILVWSTERSLMLRQSSAELAQVATDSLRALLYCGLGLLLASWATGQDLGKLMLSSAFFSLGLGLALKPTLGNFVSGLIMRLSGDFSLGELVQIGDTKGLVKVINWRSVGLSTLTADLILIPHSQIARSLVINYSRPTRQRALYAEFRLARHYPPSLARQHLEAILAATPEVLSEPAPEVFLMSFEGWANTYRARCWVDEALLEPQRLEAIQVRIAYGLERANLEISGVVHTWIGWADDPSVSEAHPQ